MADGDDGGHVKRVTGMDASSAGGALTAGHGAHVAGASGGPSGAAEKARGAPTRDVTTLVEQRQGPPDVALTITARQERVTVAPGLQVAMPEVALACGSMSTTTTRRSRRAATAARPSATVVLPTPPFWLTNATTVIGVSR